MPEFAKLDKSVSKEVYQKISPKLEIRLWECRREARAGATPGAVSASRGREAPRTRRRAEAQV